MKKVVRVKTKVSAEIHITKLAAAERQLNAAIRLTFLNEDDLAIHTIAAAAYRILRDLQEQRGTAHLQDALTRGIYAIAQDIVNGDEKRHHEILSSSPEAMAEVGKIVQAIRAGSVTSHRDNAPVAKYQEREFWNSFNAAANFLKHADLDADTMLSLESVDNERVLTRASATYFHIMGRTTPEMDVFFVYIHRATDPEVAASWWPAENHRKFRVLSHAKQRRFCLSLLRDLKRAANRPHWRPPTSVAVVTPSHNLDP